MKSVRQYARRRRSPAVVLAVGAVIGVIAFQQVAGGSSGPQAVPASADAASLRLRVGIGADRTESIDLSAARADGRLDLRRLRSILASRIPARWIVTAGTARVSYRLSRAAALRAVVVDRDGLVRMTARPVSSTIRAPAIAQLLRNNCESAALEILLATVGTRVPQLRIQESFPVDGTLDPVGEGASRVWGDPELGYVGRPDGGGIAGGFGVYERPVAATAKRLGVVLEDVSRQPAPQIVQRAREGRAVMAWIGLSDGPYGEWLSPAGRSVRVNYGEHAVVLVGVTRDGRLRVVNPLQGTREIWTVPEFEQRWSLLDRRALAVPA